MLRLMSGLKNLIHDIHRRSLWQVLGIYLVGSWIALQVVQTLTESLGMPAWFPQMAVILLVIGLPVVLATAFVQEGSGRGPPGEPTGPSPEADTGANLAGGTGSLDVPSTRPPRAQRLFTWKNAIGGGIVALALWGALAGVWLFVRPGGSATLGGGGEADRPSIAVLPFAIRSASEEDAFFVDGMHDDILTALSKISALKVISRTSVMEYRGQTANVRQIAQELNAQTVLEGGVQRAGGRVRINLQLIDAATDEHLWAETYEREMSVDNVFVIQSEIARAVAAELEAALAPEEAARIASVLTRDPVAYERYLKARETFASGGQEGWTRSAQLYEEAVELDPGFVEAYLGVAAVHALIHWFGIDRSPDRLEAARVAVEQAVALDPESPDVHLGVGLYLYRSRQYEAAMGELLIAAPGLPNSAPLFRTLGYIQRRMGRFEEAAQNLRKAYELDPRSANTANSLGKWGIPLSPPTPRYSGYRGSAGRFPRPVPR